jgi:hypothetical protein
MIPTAPPPSDIHGEVLGRVISHREAASEFWVTDYVSRSLKYRLEVHPILNVCRVAWTGTSPHRADRLIQPTPTAEQREEIEEARTKVETCREYLREILRDGPVEVRQAKPELGNAGFSVRTVERAARALGVKLRRDSAWSGCNCPC